MERAGWLQGLDAKLATELERFRDDTARKLFSSRKDAKAQSSI
jgi:hypothetical protein